MFECIAAVVNGKSQAFQLTRLTLDEPRPDEVVVEIVGVGVCHTDIVVRDQYYPTPLPAVLGHEGAGVVVKVGSAVTKVAPGDHVVLAYGSCGKCENCQKGDAGYCLEFFGYNFGGGRSDGSTPYHAEDDKRISGCFFCQSSFGTHALATERNVVKVDKDVPLEILGPLGCGISTGAGTVMNALRPIAGTSIAVFGAGSVGLAAIMAAKVVGCTTIIAVDLNYDRLKLAKELGATHAIDGRSGDVVGEIQKLTGGLGAHYSLECTSIPAVFRQAVDCLRLTGVCALVGAAALGTEVSLDMNNILFGRTVRGVIEGESVPDIFIPQLIALWKQGRFPFDKLITFYDLKEINQACADSVSGKVLKPVLRPAQVD
ncbi:NAD(P)-dependent alcohol dehydrogenase [Paraburkholderia phenoliruptrix]|uniref:NAD(P)-dependent alcohol dehydrogenase n=1 Tax=Paraburkholderia phenoliruptrix TaxID=252970 RepID=UPI002869AE8E|nr:NAD(P)-dependent alcohol dehydrogenase [Paraburkholderia phenoliruptrix]WMY09563.1 NAD(P)-dependent alcohol dehydrogenase [Paraburkholderia phenoliruptrix]